MVEKGEGEATNEDVKEDGENERSVNRWRGQGAIHR